MEDPSRKTPEQEDAQRRFLLALRALTVRKQKEEQSRAAVEKWTKTLEEEIRAYRRWRRKKQMRWVRIGLFCGLLVLFQLKLHNIPGLWWILWITLGGKAAADAAVGRRHETASALARAGDPLAVSALAVACRDGDKETQAMAARGLKSILPSLRSSDVQYITSEGMEALIGLLRSPDPRLVLAVLRGLEQVGDARALPAIDKLIANPIGRAPEWRDVQDAARQCLPYLHARVANERARQVLLRPAQSPVDPASTLLRPAGAAPTTPQEQLLRPSSPES